jgi:acyl-CoA thioester hydrolase
VFSTRLKVRTYELDALGHVNQAVYHQYAEVARLGLLEAAGADIAVMIAARKAIVMLESTMVYRRELRAGDEIDITGETKFGSGKTFHMSSKMIRSDAVLSAEVTCTLGMMDLDARKLLSDPATVLVELGADLDVLSGQ